MSKSVVRIDNQNRYTHGWQVRVHLGKSKNTISKFFSDSTYGGSENAFSNAIQYRNAIEAKNGKLRSERCVRFDKTGIRRVTNHSRDYYEITWSPYKGKVGRTSVSIKKHGKEKALMIATNIRNSKIKEFYSEH